MSMARQSMLTFGVLAISVTGLWADGKVVPPRDYAGSLEETAQEAIIIFHGVPDDESKAATTAEDGVGGAVEDMILKIQVAGEAASFAWVVPFPSQPEVTKESPKLFKELFDYVESRNRPRYKSEGTKQRATNDAKPEAAGGVEVLSREVVGEFDVAIVRENKDGGLNPWLEKEGFQPLENAEDVLRFYRDKKYVFACMKVSSEALAEKKEIESHPLRFTFRTGGRDGIYFPMKMTSLQTEPFSVNLYVFYRFWLNDKLSRFGYQHHSFLRRYRDWDTSECIANGGKSYYSPQNDPFLSGYERRLPTVVKLMKERALGKKFYLTNIQAKAMEPAEVRQWKDDLWLFPYYTDRNMVPYDARVGGVAHAGYPDVKLPSAASAGSNRDGTAPVSPLQFTRWMTIALSVGVGLAVVCVVVGAVFARRPQTT